MNKYIAIVLPLNPISKSTGGMVAFMNHLKALNDASTGDYKKICYIAELNSSDNSRQRSDIIESFTAIEFVFLKNKFSSNGGKMFRKLLMLTYYALTRQPFDVMMRNSLWEREQIELVNSSEIIIIDHLYSIGLLSGLNIKKKQLVYVAHNIESDIVLQRATQERSFPKRLLWKVDHKRTIQAESQLIDTSISRVFISAADRIKINCGKSIISTEIIAPSERLWSYSKSKSIVFIGGMDYFPNMDAIRWLKFELFPLIRILDPQVSISVFGKTIPSEVASLAEIGFNIHGFVDQSILDHQLLNCAFFISPVDLGSGIKIKMLEALSRGVPIVATRNSLAGLESIRGIQLIDRSAPSEAAKVCHALLEDEASLNSMSANSYSCYKELSNSNWSFKAIIEDFCKSVNL